MGKRTWFQLTNDDTETPTITAGAYSAGDAVGGLLTFDIIQNHNIGGIIKSVVITDKAKQSVEFDLVLFNQTFTPTADNAAFDVSDADLLNCVGVANIPTTAYMDFVDNSVAIVGNLFVSAKSADDNGKLYGQLITRGTPTYASTSDLQIRVIMEVDRS